MGQTLHAYQIAPWMTLVVMLPAIGLMWRSMLRLEDRLGRRIEGTGGRLRTVENGRAEIKGKLDFVEAHILGRNDTRTAPAE